MRKSPPTSLKANVEQIATDWDRMATSFDQVAVAIRARNNQAATQAVASGQAANDAGNKLAERIGLPDCAEAGGIGVTTNASPAPSGVSV